MDYGMVVVYLSHVTDGCSRFSFIEGLMAGKDMLTFIDLGREDVDHHPPVGLDLHLDKVKGTKPSYPRWVV